MMGALIIGAYLGSGLTGDGVPAPAVSGPEVGLDVAYSTKRALPSFDQTRSIFGSILDQGVDPLVECISSFYADLAASQEPLGAEFSRVLHENLWDLYER